MAAMQAKYPDDIFEAVLRKNATSGVYEFRIKCSDCPGKVRASAGCVISLREAAADGKSDSTIPPVRERRSRTLKSI